MSKKRVASKANDEEAVLAKIAEMPEPYRTMGMRLHEVITKSVPALKPRLWYGMPGYALSKSRPVLCYFRKDDYMTFGLSEKANFTREEGATDQLMPHAWFFTDFDKATEEKVAEIVSKAVISN